MIYKVNIRILNLLISRNTVIIVIIITWIKGNSEIGRFTPLRGHRHLIR
jgi:hypothetical protein